MSEDIKQLGIFLHIFHSSIVTNGHTNHKKTNCVAKNIILGFSIIKNKMSKGYDNFAELVDFAFCQVA